MAKLNLFGCLSYRTFIAVDLIAALVVAPGCSCLNHERLRNAHTLAGCVRYFEVGFVRLFMAKNTMRVKICKLLAWPSKRCEYVSWLGRTSDELTDELTYSTCR